jgi:hypothetical protein
MTQTAAAVFRNYVIDGDPSSGVNQPAKSDISAWGTYLESAVSQLLDRVDELERRLAALEPPAKRSWLNRLFWG